MICFHCFLWTLSPFYVGNCFANGGLFFCATDDQATGDGGGDCNTLQECGGPQFDEDCGQTTDDPRPTCQQVLADRCNVDTPGICVSVTPIASN